VGRVGEYPLEGMGNILFGQLSKDVKNYCDHTDEEK
jgi:hypothetical protein